MTVNHGRGLRSILGGRTAGHRVLALLLCISLPLPHNSAFLHTADGTKLNLDGERLVFRVEWSPPWYLFFVPTMDAGEAEIRLDGKARYGDKKAAKIIFEARSSGTLANLAGVRVDDHFEFITDPETFCTYSAVKKIREGKRKRDIEVIYMPESRKLHFREVDVAVDPPIVKKDEDVNDIPACVRDPFSALYALRKEEFTEGATYTSLVGNDLRTKDVRSRIERKEIANTPLGKYSTWKIETVALMGGLFKDGGQFRMWLTADEKKIPVLFEVRVNLGKVIGKVKSIQGAD